jgi:hypothetical protein
MAKRNYKPEEIVSKLRQADVQIAQGSKIPDIMRGLQTDQVKFMKDMELENPRLRRAVTDLTPEKLILADGLVAGPNHLRHGRELTSHPQLPAPPLVQLMLFVPDRVQLVHAVPYSKSTNSAQD